MGSLALTTGSTVVQCSRKRREKIISKMVSIMSTLDQMEAIVKTEGDYEHAIEAIEETLIGRNVIPKYDSEMQTIYTIKAIHWGMTPRTKMKSHLLNISRTDTTSKSKKWIN